ncbi:MerR family transcriptional regulator [Streptosporangium sp. NPDC051023]|uniref:MerR family transcriptional regulator n=1 Tax=Streptosporangium sp. NPDC051023 TaxID=3155410 RepID=UPI00344B11FE
MRISQLSATSGVPIPTIKYYLREGLLPSGEQTSATRAEYGEAHVRRLRLIRALLEVGRLPIASIGRVLAAVDDEKLSMHRVLGTAHYAIAPAVAPHADDEDWRRARAEADRLISDLGWRIEPWAPTRNELAQAVHTLSSLGMPATGEALQPYAKAAAALVEHEIDTIPLDGPRETAVEALVVGTVVHGRVLDVLRRLAHESASARVFEIGDTEQDRSA